jgi:hypothetical protein
MLPDGPVTVPQRLHVSVDLSQQGNIAQAGLLRKRLRRGVTRRNWDPAPGSM